MRGRGPGPRGHPPGRRRGVWAAGARVQTGGRPAGKPEPPGACRAGRGSGAEARAPSASAHLRRESPPPPRGRPGSVLSQAQEVRGRRWGAPRGAPLTPGPVPRSSFDCSGDRRRPLGAAGRTRVLASRVDSNLGSSACHLREHKHLIVLLGHRSFHVYNGITMNDS